MPVPVAREALAPRIGHKQAMLIYERGGDRFHITVSRTSRKVSPGRGRGDFSTTLSCSGRLETG